MSSDTKQLQKAVADYARGVTDGKGGDAFEPVREALAGLAAPEPAQEGAVLGELRAIRQAVEADRVSSVDQIGRTRSQIIKKGKAP